MLSFSDALKVNWYRRFSANGRAARSEFWWLYLGYIVINALLMVIARAGSIISLLCLIVILLTLAATLCCAARRLHDRDLAAWWLLVILIPGFGQLILLILCALPGTRGPNRFGPDPLQDNFYPSILSQGNAYRSQERYEWYQWNERSKPNDQSNYYDQGHSDQGGTHFNPFGSHDDFGEQLRAQRKNDRGSDRNHDDDHRSGGGFAP